MAWRTTHFPNSTKAFRETIRGLSPCQCNQPLIQLGWMDAETGKLIPPPEIEATPATSLPPNR